MIVTLHFVQQPVLDHSGAQVQAARCILILSFYDDDDSTGIAWGNITLGPPQISEEYKHKPHSFQIKTADASGTELIIKITDQSERSLLFMFLIGQYLIQPKVPN